MFQAGSVIGKVILDSNDWTSNASKVNKSNESMFASMLKSQLAADALRKSMQFVTDAFKNSLNSFIQSEKAIAQTNATLKSTGYAAGLTAREVLDLSSTLESLTAFSDDAILSAENLLLTFTNIGKNVFPLATETILDMSTAMGQDLKSSALQLGKALQDPIEGIGALKRVGVNFTDAQEQMIKTLVASGNILDAQKLILVELQKEFGGSAKAARDTFGGALNALNNSIDNTQEVIGGIIASIGRDFVESLNNVVIGINEFLKTEEGLKLIRDIISNVSAAFELVKNVIGTIANAIKTEFLNNLDRITTKFGEVAGGATSSNIGLMLLAKAVNVISTGFGVAASLVSGFVRAIINAVNIATKAANIFQSFGDILLSSLTFQSPEQAEKKNKAFADSIAGFGNAISTTFTDLIADVNIVEKKMRDVFSTIFEDNTKQVKEYSDLLLKTQKDTNNKLIQEQTKMNTQLQTIQKQPPIIETQQKSLTEQTVPQITTNIDDTENILKEREKIYDQFYANLNNSSKNQYQLELEKIDDLTNTYRDAGIDEIELTQWGEEQKTKIIKEQQEAQRQMILSNISKIGGFMQSSLSQLGSIFDMYYQNQLTAEDNDYAKKKEYIEQNITDEQEKAKALDQLEAEHQKKQKEIKKQQWESQKSMSIAQAIIQTANAVVATLAAYPWPWSIIPASIVAGLGAAQISLISAQPMPQFALGGVVSPGLALVGEQGPEIVNIGSTSRVMNNRETSSLLGNSGSNVNINFTGDIYTNEDIEKSMQLAGSRYKELLRGVV